MCIQVVYQGDQAIFYADSHEVYQGNAEKLAGIAKRHGYRPITHQLDAELEDFIIFLTIYWRYYDW